MTSEWHEVPLRELVGYISKGIAPSYAEEASETTIRVLNQKCNRNFRISYGDSRLHDTLKKKVPPERYVKPDDILINSTGAGTAGRIAQIEDVPSATTIDGHMILIRSNRKVTQKFLGYALKAHQWEVLQLDEGSTGQTELNRDRLLDEIMINYPVSFDEQNAIVGTLESIDRKLIVNKEINDNLQQQAKSLYEEMFLNNPDADMVSGTLSDIATITMGQSPSGSSYNEESVGEIFYQGRAEFGFRFPTRRLFTTEPKRMAEPGDVLLSVRAPVGDLNVAYEKCCIGRGLGAIHSKTGDSSFMLYTMFALKPQLDVFNGEGTVFGSINRNGLSNLPVNIPSAEEIAKFEATVRPMDNLIRTNYEEICRLQSIRDSLLPKLMSGEIDVSDIQL